MDTRTVTISSKEIDSAIEVHCPAPFQMCRGQGGALLFFASWDEEAQGT